MPSRISYDSSHKTYTIQPGANVNDIALAARDAPSGATLLFAAGTHRLTDTLIIERGDITIRGASRDSTTIVVAHDDAEGIRFDGGDPVWQRKMTHDVSQGSKSFTIPSGVTLQAGDVVGLHMANDSSLSRYGDYNPIKGGEYWYEKPLRESLVQIDRVVGSTAYLKHEIAFDMTAGKTVLAKYDLLKNVQISDLTVTYTMAAPKDFRLFDNPLGGYKQAMGILVEGTQGLDVHNVAIRNAASSGLVIRRALEPEVNSYLADGAINRGSDKNGYGLTIEEVFYGRFANLDLMNVRHSFLFSGWNAEAYNTVHIRTMNRDVNYHGGPDRANTVIVDYANYLDGTEPDGSRKSWGLVDDGGEENPTTDISKNTNLFKTAFGSFRDEEIRGWDGGAYLDGRGGNDVLLGGKGRDVLTGGIGDDYAMGGAGQDWFVVKTDDDGLTVTDFKTGSGGDILVLNGFGSSYTHASLHWTQSGSDAVLSLSGSTVRLKGVYASGIGTANIAFNLTNLKPGGAPPPASSGGKDVLGTSADDRLAGTHEINRIKGYAGDDAMNGRDGNDLMYGDSGNDRIYGEWDNDTLYGGDGGDIIDGGPGDDTLDGGRGTDRATGGAGKDTFIVTKGDEGLYIYDFASDDRLVLKGYSSSSIANAQMVQSGGDVVLRLDDGASVSFLNVRLGSLGDHQILADLGGRLTPLEQNPAPEKPPAAGNDVLQGLQNVDNLLHGGDGDDCISGRDGKDTLYGDNGNDILYGNWNDDTLYGGTGQDILDGGPGHDRLYGEDGNDILSGGDGDDIVNAGAGDDRIDGGPGQDYLFGGPGRDVFVFNRLPDTADILTDFKAGEDKIDLDRLLTGKAVATLGTVSGHTGLFIDPDGPGAAKAQLLAVFEDPGIRPALHLPDILE